MLPDFAISEIEQAGLALFILKSLCDPHIWRGIFPKNNF